MQHKITLNFCHGAAKLSSSRLDKPRYPLAAVETKRAANEGPQTCCGRFSEHDECDEFMIQAVEDGARSNTF